MLMFFVVSTLPMVQIAPLSPIIYGGPDAHARVHMPPHMGNLTAKRKSVFQISISYMAKYVYMVYKYNLYVSHAQTAKKIQFS